jgi:hypothetical protein
LNKDLYHDISISLLIDTPRGHPSLYSPHPNPSERLTPTPLLEERGLKAIYLILTPLLLKEKGPGDEVFISRSSLR